LLEGSQGGERADWPGVKFVMAKYNPFEFVQEVRQEVSKVTWPSRKEVWVTTIAVLVMVTLASIFFLLTDQFLGWVVSFVLGFGR
jgi:preprotein translocase subunit SecE